MSDSCLGDRKSNNADEKLPIKQNRTPQLSESSHIYCSFTTAYFNDLAPFIIRPKLLSLKMIELFYLRLSSKHTHVCLHTHKPKMNDIYHKRYAKEGSVAVVFTVSDCGVCKCFKLALSFSVQSIRSVNVTVPFSIKLLKCFLNFLSGEFCKRDTTTPLQT